MASALHKSGKFLTESDLLIYEQNMAKDHMIFDSSISPVTFIKDQLEMTTECKKTAQKSLMVGKFIGRSKEPYELFFQESTTEVLGYIQKYMDLCINNYKTMNSFIYGTIITFYPTEVVESLLTLPGVKAL